MPHSSGGGSHGGGSHGGSHSSSHSSHSSHSNNKVRKSHFKGADRYVRNGVNGPEYIYANYDISKKLSPLRYLLLLFYLPFFIFILTGLSLIADIPIKITDRYNNEIIVKDNIGIFHNKATLKNQLFEFQKETGITPYILTTNNEEWDDSGSLEDYAYKYYVKNFDDEYHWLIVYSQPALVGDFNDWHWEGMQGDDTDNILVESVTEKFTEYLQEQLMERDDGEVDLAIADAFAEIMPGIMSIHFHWDGFFIMLFITAFISFHCYFMVFYNPDRKYKGYKLCPEESDK